MNIPQCGIGCCLPLFITTVGLGSELDNRVEGDFDIREVCMGQIMEVRVSGIYVSNVCVDRVG